MLDNKQNEYQKSLDVSAFYSALFYKLAAKNNFTRDDFLDLIVTTSKYLPVRGGGLGKDGFWENILSIHNIPIVYNSDGNFEERIFIELADAMWLSLDQTLRNEAERQKKLDLEIKNLHSSTKK